MHASDPTRQGEGGARRRAGRGVARLLAFALLLGPGLRPAARAEEYELQGPLRARDMTPLHLARLEMVPTMGSAALDDGWTVETDVTHTNTFAKSSRVAGYLVGRGSRQDFTAASAAAVLRRPGDVLYLDGEIGRAATTVHYRSSPRLSLFVTLQAFYFTGGAFDGLIESYHGALGLAQDYRNFVSRNRFGIVYRVGRERVAQIGVPASGLSDPVGGARFRLLPPGAPWDLILSAAVKPAVRAAGALSTGGTDAGLQLALHRTFGRQGIYLDASAVRIGGPLADPRADRRLIPAYVAAYEFGLSHHTSAVAQLYVSPSVFSHSDVIELVQWKWEVLAGIHSRQGPLVWTADLIENIVHNDNTPDVGAQLGVTWHPGGR